MDCLKYCLLVLVLAIGCTVEQNNAQTAGTGESFGGGDPLFRDELLEIRENSLVITLRSIELRAEDPLDSGKKFGDVLCDFDRYCSGAFQFFGQSAPGLCASKPQLSEQESAECAETLMRNLPDLLTLVEPSGPDIHVSAARLYVNGVEVAAKTLLDTTSPIIINQPLVRDDQQLNRLQKIQLLGHEYMHKVLDPLYGRHFEDSGSVGAFASSQRLLNAIGYALAFHSLYADLNRD